MHLQPHPPGLLENLCTALFLVFLILIIIMLTLIVVWNIVYTGSKEIFHVTWDLLNLEKELDENVFGQEQAIKRIKKILRRVTTNINLVQHNDPSPEHQVIFLLGGPGVGKHLVLNIIEKHIFLERYDLLDTITKPLKISVRILQNNLEGTFNGLESNDLVSGVTYYYSNINTSLKTFTNNKKDESLLRELARIKNVITNKSRYLNCSLINNYIYNNKSLHFVTGSCLTERKLKTFKDIEEYNHYIVDQALKLEEYFSIHNTNLKVSIITFKAIEYDDFEAYLKNKNLKSEEFNNIETNFVPLGYKTSVEYTEC